MSGNEQVPATYYRVTVEQMTGPDAEAKVMHTHVFHRLGVTSAEHKFDVDVELPKPPEEVNFFSSRRRWPPPGPVNLLMAVRAEMIPVDEETSRLTIPPAND